MDRFFAAFRHLQSNPESLMNGVSALLALAGVRLYGSYRFSCPCLPFYNTLYGLGVLLLPPVALFLCGVMVNGRWALLLLEARRPEGNRGRGRERDGQALRYLLLSVLQGAALAPAAWIIVALLDGKCVVCAFSASVEPARFANVSGYREAEIRSALARVPCRDLAPAALLRHPPFPAKAMYRYLRTISQAVGWSAALLLILAAFLARTLGACSRPASHLHARYWGNYLHLEQKIFEEMCWEHAQAFARRSVGQFFTSGQSGAAWKGGDWDRTGEGGDGGEEAASLRGITNRDQLNLLLQRWIDARPPLNVGGGGADLRGEGGQTPALGQNSPPHSQPPPTPPMQVISSPV
ncbi:calcium homeostasis modulator protein 3-like [Amblyraja radiata]|uniref:calcium homeostasis modulator protein 3-like n=1 Tax=Amblyraja radiata TaxID=386614 RepID=UPI001402413F|nr:calcium homeostasis modulator protein 3-like [Amblyraja radiata]